jgi:hypothetical protein
MTIIKIKIEALRQLLTDRVEHFEYSNRAKIPFKVHSFIQVMNLRMIDFCEATDLLIKSNHITPSLTLIRSLFENAAIVYRISYEIDKSLNSNKLIENFDDLITKISFGTRYDSEVSAINIMTNLEKLDKEYNGIKKFYDSLCEFVHPNWDGVEGSYSMLNEKDRYTDINKVMTTKHPLFDFFESCFLLCMGVYLQFSKRISTNLPSFSILCESEIDKK